LRLLKHETVLCGGEAWGPGNGYMNIQNNRHWSAESPVTILEAKLHDAKVCVLCVISATEIVNLRRSDAHSGVI